MSNDLSKAEPTKGALALADQIRRFLVGGNKWAHQDNHVEVAGWIDEFAAHDGRAELIAAAQALLHSADYADDSRPLMSDLRAALAKASPNQGSQQ